MSLCGSREAGASLTTEERTRGATEGDGGRRSSRDAEPARNEGGFPDAPPGRSSRTGPGPDPPDEVSPERDDAASEHHDDPDGRGNDRGHGQHRLGADV